MARVNNLSNFLTDVASAIKTKKGSETAIPAASFDTEILALPSQGTYEQRVLNISANGAQTITPSSGYDAIDELELTVAVPEKQLQSKTYNFTQNTNIQLLPDTGYDGFNQVNLEIDVQGGVNNQDKTITQNGTYMADTGYTGLGTVNVNVGDGLYWSTSELPSASSVGDKILATVVTPSAETSFTITQSDNIVYSFLKSSAYAQINNSDKQFMIFGRTDSNSNFTDYYAFVYFSNSMKFTMYNETSGNTGLFMNFNSKTETNFYGYVYHYDDTDKWAVDNSLTQTFSNIIESYSSSTFGILLHFDGESIWGDHDTFANRIIPYLFNTSTLSANTNYIVGLTQSLYRNQDLSTLMQAANLTNAQIEYHSSYSTLSEVLAAQGYGKLDLYWSNNVVWSKIASSSNVALPNLFIQETEPETYDGIWIETDSLAYDNIVEVTDKASLIANSINIVKGDSHETILFYSNNGLSYRFDTVYLTDENNEILSDIEIYYGDGSQWKKLHGYTELEYIQSTGTQYINTGLKGSNNLKFELVFTISSMSNEDAAFIGARSDYRKNALDLTSHNKGWFVYGNDTEGELSIDFATNTKYYIQIDNNVVRYKLSDVASYTNIKTFSAQTFTTDYNVLLFGENWKGSPLNFSKIKLYNAKIYNNNTLIRNLVPVKRNSDDEICLYDTVTETFYVNAGTGDFIAGGEV